MQRRKRERVCAPAFRVQNMDCAAEPAHEIDIMMYFDQIDRFQGWVVGKDVNRFKSWFPLWNPQVFLVWYVSGIYHTGSVRAADGTLNREPSHWMLWVVGGGYVLF